MKKELYRNSQTMHDLTLIKQFIERSDRVAIYGELEIEPFAAFSINFQAEYWYLKYMLLKDGEVYLNGSEQTGIYQEKKLNVIWLSVKNESDTIIECRDGAWFATVSDKDQNNKELLLGYKFYHSTISM